MIHEQFTPKQKINYCLNIRGTRNIWPMIFQNHMEEFPTSRLPSKEAVRHLIEKQNTKFTMHNCNSKNFPFFFGDILNLRFKIPNQIT